ncbi:nucleoside-triphosphatase [Parvimonas parva]|uniref:nucleoside-triphosphatase n=1 Tax=Parvimonas parva TaxID=2769485 RepID=UPI0038B2FB30
MTNFKDLDFLVESLRKVDNGKNHIFITGNIKVGKTTLLKAFIEKYYKDSKIDGIMTELVITDLFRIELFRYGTDERFVIGERKNEMEFFDDVFLKKSFEFMEDFKDNDILIFDEIGNKELHLREYSKKLLSLFEKNRIFAVLKKAGNPIFENLKKLNNFVIFDLDKFYE